jgi:predicted lipoprotein with Yx(FWY)xxD motif
MPIPNGKLTAVPRTLIPALAGVVLTLLVLTGCGGSANSGSSPSSTEGNGVAIGVKHEGNLGPILYAGPNKLTVYAFEADHGRTSTCTGACARAWPPVTTSGKPRALGGASASALGTTKREGAVQQITYHGHPLYYYTDDKTAATATGQASTAFGAPWYVLGPRGNTVTTITSAEGNVPSTTTEKTRPKVPPRDEEKPPGRGGGWG